MTEPKQRILIKISGEALGGQHVSNDGNKSVFDPAVFDTLVSDIEAVLAMDKYEICLVVGGGNFVRVTQTIPIGVRRVTSDHIGMLATMMNALALRDALQQRAMPAVVQSAVSLPSFCETVNCERAEQHIAQGRIVIFGGGTGNPLFTTDMAACVRAIEMNCVMMLKATKVDGVYTADPTQSPDAKRYRTLSYADVLKQELGVMDAAAFGLARDHKLPMVVFSMSDRGALQATLAGMDNARNNGGIKSLFPDDSAVFTVIGDCDTTLYHPD